MMQDQQTERLFYDGHAILGTVLATVGAPPLMTASEWFKAAWHSHSKAELEQAQEGLMQAAARGDAQQLESSLCPYVSGWSYATQWGARGRQLTALSFAKLTCVDDDGFFGSVPDGYTHHRRRHTA